MKTNTKKGSIQKKRKKWTALISFSTLLLLSSCAEDEGAISNLEANDGIQLSSKSIELTSYEITASTEQSIDPISNIDDDDLTTRWAGYGIDASVYYDFKEIVAVDYTKIAFYKGDERVYSFSYWVSKNGVDWTRVGGTSSSGSTEAKETFDLANMTTRYFRIKFQGNSENDWNSIFDIEVYGNTIEENALGVFSLDDFQIETSWLTGEDDTKTESFDPLQVEQEQEWFNQMANGAYVLKCLRKFGNRTEWKESEGKEASLFTRKNLKFVSIFEDIPEHGVTIAQVHNRASGVKRPLLRVYVHDDHKVWIKVTDTTPDENTSTYRSYKGPDYVEGTEMKVQILIENGEITINIETTEGSLLQTIVPTSDWDEFSESYYLKAGVYTEGDDKFTKATFNYFVVEK